ncbi:MAG: YitT family protein, partial [Longimicrobiaceae bacterium]
ILGLNVVIFLAAAFFLGVEQALYSILTYFAASRTLDFVVHGIEEYTAILVVSTRSDEVRAAITGELGRGVTVLRGRGGVSDAEQDVLYCVVTRLEIGRVKGVVRTIDPTAFVIIHSLNDAEGGVVPRKSAVH